MSGQLKETLEKAVEQGVVGTDIFLVDVKVSPAKISVLIDKPSGINITECTNLARQLHEALDESGIFGSHELEVSSPGMEEPLKVLKQYQKRIGKEVRVLTSNGIVKKGILKAANADGVELEEKLEKKIDRKKTIEINNLQIPFNQIKETKVIFSFK